MKNIFFDLKKLKHCGKNVVIGKTTRIRCPEKVSIGDNAILDDFTYISGEVEIGRFVHIASCCTVAASKSQIIFKDFSGISAGCRIFACSSNYVKACLDLPTFPEEYSYGTICKPVILESYSLLGANCVVLPGCHIPEGMAVAAGVKVVSRKYEAWTLLLDNDGKNVMRTGVDRFLSKIKRIQ